MRSKTIAAAAAAALLAPAAASAHIAASPNAAAPGAYVAVAFRVGHACATGEATTKVRLEIPKGVNQPRYRALPGWKVATEKSADGHIDAFVWTGRLPDDQFQQFEVLFRAPDEAGALYFPAVQTCTRSEARWVEIPKGDGAALSHPAPVVTIAPAPAGGEHQHH